MMPSTWTVVVSYRNSTSNHNHGGNQASQGVVVSYRNSTSNHNSCLCISEETALYLIEILHQTTTQTLPVIWHIGCILSKFYIKPQLCRTQTDSPNSCILSKFYIKPQLWIWQNNLRVLCPVPIVRGLFTLFWTRLSNLLELVNITRRKIFVGDFWTNYVISYLCMSN